MTDAELLSAACAARENAYTPHSSFAVGAALAGRERVFVGCNVENISFGLTMCAERVAVGAAVAAGVRQFDRLVIVSDSFEPVVPCGACRQVLAEFGGQLRILSWSLSGSSTEFDLETLLPVPRQGILG